MILLLLRFAVSSFTPFEFTWNGNKTSLLEDAQRCMEFNGTISSTHTKVARAHYADLMKASKKTWKIERPAYCGCSGPFLENEWIRRYKDKDLSFFEPFIPLFVPWFGHYQVDSDKDKYNLFVAEFMKKLRPDYVYLTISECDYGIALRDKKRAIVPKNVLIMSASGMGHVAVPWLQGDAIVDANPPRDIFLSFCGNPRSSIQRKDIFAVVRGLFGSDLYEYRGPKWRDVTLRSIFGFSPARHCCGDLQNV